MPQTRLPTVVEELQLDAVSIDYVVVVDTSGSMQESGLYPRVTGALRTFFAAMKPSDHLSILTFDTAPTLRYSDRVGPDPSTAIGQLPPVADGRGTDIGAGIAAGLAELERPGRGQVGAIVLVTDGQIQADGSPYATAESRAWNSLTDRANRLTANHHIASYAYALAPTTDAALLKKVFHDTVVVAIPPAQVEGYLNRVTEETVRHKATGALQRDAQAGVEATWGTDVAQLNLGDGEADFPVVLRSTFSRVPIVVCDFSIEIKGFDAHVSGAEQPIDLRPGESKEVHVHLSVDSMGGFGFGKRTETRSGTVAFTGTVGTPWSHAITEDLGVPFAPKLTSPPGPISVVGTTGWSWVTLVSIPLAALLLGIALWTARRLRMPKLTGALELMDEGRPVTEFALGGKVYAFGKGKHAIPGKNLVGNVRAVHRTDDYQGGLEHGVLVAAKLGTTRRSARLFSGDSLDIDSVTITYTNYRK
ncbi:vWA domain-containing protein [Nocardia altamirensis]|uniref:vWA domain-containing protein n=1 Tax=Nocardia altamirensis TaxID=472158 RepID=UPI00084008BF|nr:vWA domain-containing protein [Nocardia altamirensis]